MPPPCAWPPDAVSSWCKREALVEEAPQRRRLWARIIPARAHLVGQAGHLMAELVRQAGAKLDEVEGQESDG